MSTLGTVAILGVVQGVVMFAISQVIKWWRNP